MKPAELKDVVDSASASYEHANQLFAPDATGLDRITSELREMVADILQAPADAHVTLTGGGTESNFLAVQAAREWAREVRHVATPNVVVPYTAHPSVDKACFLLGIGVVRIPARGDYRADVDAMSRAVTPDTILIAGSAPSYSHGVVDDIPALAELAAEHDAWMHVDACVGGFLLPFLRDSGRDLPAFDFTVPGVRSISADLHKFGYCPHGVSSLTVRHGEDTRYHTWETVQWPFGHYGRTRFAGSAPAAPIVGAWATMQYLGREGYMRIASTIIRNGEFLQAGVAGIEGIEVLREPEAGIIAFRASDDLSIPALVAAMRARGRSAYWCEQPPALHVLLDPVDQGVLERYLADLAAAVEDVRAGRVTVTNAVATYGSLE